MILTNGKDSYIVTTDAQIDALKACGFYEAEEKPRQKKTKDTDETI